MNANSKLVSIMKSLDPQWKRFVVITPDANSVWTPSIKEARAIAEQAAETRGLTVHDMTGEPA